MRSLAAIALLLALACPPYGAMDIEIYYGDESWQFMTVCRLQGELADYVLCRARSRRVHGLNFLHCVAFISGGPMA